MGSYVYFQIGQHNFAIEIEHVVEVQDMVKVAPLPRTPEFVVGVANFRGEILPVIDLKLRFKLGSNDTTDKRYIIVLKYFMENVENFLAFVVDRVLGVSNGEKLDMEQLPQEPLQQIKQYISGGVRFGDGFAYLLDKQKVLQELAVSILHYVKSGAKNE